MVLHHHAWGMDSESLPEETFCPSACHELCAADESTDAVGQVKLEEEHGLQLHTLLRESIFAIVIGHFDVSHASVIFAQHASAPAVQWQWEPQQDPPARPDEIKSPMVPTLECPLSPHQLGADTDSLHGDCPCNR